MGVLFEPNLSLTSVRLGTGSDTIQEISTAAVKNTMEKSLCFSLQPSAGSVFCL